MNIHKALIRKALTLATRGYGKVAPNPLVGAILVRDGEPSKIIGRGWYSGTKHAEVVAIEQALQESGIADVREVFSGTTLYCTLEPCTGMWKGKKQPPCAERIIEVGIPRVYIAHSDPNPNIAGRGIERLRAAGVEVHVGYLEEECRKLNEIFIHNCTEHRPFILLKIAQSIDGNIAMHDKQSKWITSAQSRKEGHRLRSVYDAVLVGIGTVLADNPSLTVRDVKGRNPLRMVLDSRLRTPLDSNIVQLARDGKSYIFFCEADAVEKESSLRELGVNLVRLASPGGGAQGAQKRVGLSALVRWLHEHGVTSLLVEGGAEVYSAFTGNALFDKLQIYLAPKVLGKGISAFAALKLDKISNAVVINNVHVRTVRGSNDYCIEAYRTKAPSKLKS